MSNTTRSSIEEQVPHENFGRSTPLGTPTQRKLAGIRRSVELGYLLFLQYQAKLSPGQWAYLLGLQRRVQLQELNSAISLFNRLLASERSSARAQKDLQILLARTPHLSPKLIRREQRRIGVGYRDKGTLRQPHEDHKVPPRIWWWEDICSILQLSSDWIESKDYLAEEDLAQSNLIRQLSSFGTGQGFLQDLILWNQVDRYINPGPPLQVQIPPDLLG